ncbi:MAG: GGDEF domain-containing protein, partial [Desulfamplus sp.]|nr:GGDEF domain-containing protein [Desulfamplus sp.]
PLGIIRETAFKSFIFHKYGRQLLENPTFGKDISRFITKTPIADMNTSLERMLEVYARFSSNEGIIIIDNQKYAGFISSQSLLKIINERNLTQARNQNPLTKLPGNTMIHEYFSRALSDTSSGYVLIYFDFDHFKPFNDIYGFRNGDRLILMFSEILKEAVGLSPNRFAGHVGGDDFFLGIKGCSADDILAEVNLMADRFKRDAESFYDPRAIKNGYIVAKDRDGVEKKIPLTSISTAILELPPERDSLCSIEDAGNIMAGIKNKAKASPRGFCIGTLLGDEK